MAALAAPPGHQAPDWLGDMVSYAFFAPCAKHASHSARDCATNHWAISGACGPACSLCVAAQPQETHLQVRRSSYHDVVKMADIARYADISGIQGYTINSSKVIFLRRRPQPRPPKGAVGASLCSVCSRHLQDVSRFCSLQCKLDSQAGVTHVSLRAVQVPAAGRTHSSGSSARSGSGPETPAHPSALRALDGGTSSSDSECMADFNGPPVKRRKGCPLRAPAL